jgi:microcystin-dependent protein
MAYVDAANYNRIKSMKGYPIGSVIPWSGAQDSIPPGWIISNGATVAINRYPLLYECIGNSYGGIEDSTFRLPPLTANNKAIADYHRGYHAYLQSSGTSYGPVSRPRGGTIESHIFWNEIGLGFNGDEAGNVQTSYISTIDVVGEFATRPTNFVASFSAIEMTQGEESVSVSYNSRKLGDGHMPSHSHGLEFSNDANAWAQLGRLALKAGETYGCGRRKDDILCISTGPRDRACRCNVEATATSRATRYLRFGNNQNHLREDFLTWTQPSGSGNATGTGPAGGGGTIVDGGSLSFQEKVLLYRAGDGYGRGDMLSSGNVFFSSLSNSEVSFSQITGHNHGLNTYNFIANISVINPGIVTNVSLNNVNINNSAGINYGTITVNTATANLSMIFIIKAY